MADQLDDIFKDLGPAPATATPPPMPGAATKPLDLQHRMILQNFFPSDQPKRREAYLKQLGYEMDPSDPNQYKPLGSQSGYAEVDPGVIKELRQGHLATAFNNLSDKAKGEAFTMAVNGTLMGGGSAAGAVAGSALGPWGSLLGGILGGALGYRTGDAFRQTAGDMLLNENVPPDQHAAAVQALIAGAAPKVMEAGTKLTSDAFNGILNATKTGIGYAAKRFGAGMDAATLVKAATNPEDFSPEAVKGSTEKLGSMYRDIMGVDPDKAVALRSTKAIPPNSMLGQIANPLNQTADGEVSRLSNLPQANWTVDELTAPMKAQVEKLATQFDRTSEENAALGYLRDKVDYIEGAAKKLNGVDLPEGAAGPDVDVGKLQIPYGAGRQVIKSIQNDAFDSEVPGSSYLRQLSGGDPNGIKVMADAKAAKAYQMLADEGTIVPPQQQLQNVNAARSKLLALGNEAQRILTPSSMETAFIGGDKIAKQDVQNLFAKLGQATGNPELGSDVQMLQMQRQMELLYKSKGNFGSGNILLTGMPGAALGAAAGTPLGVGGQVVGGLTGFSAGAALGRPTGAMAAIRGLSGIQDAANAVAAPVGQALATPQAAAVAAQALAPQPATQQHNYEDIFSGL